MAGCSVVLAPTFSQAKLWNMARAQGAGTGAFADAAIGFDAWIDKLWELNGDGRPFATPSQGRLAAQAVADAHEYRVLAPAPGLGAAIYDCARKGAGIIALDASDELDASAAASDALAAPAAPPAAPASAALTQAEQEMLACVDEYYRLLQQRGIIERGCALAYLAERADEVFPRDMQVKMVGDEPLTPQQEAFFARCPQLHLQHEFEPSPPLTACDHAEVRMALCSGHYAQAPLLLRAIDSYFAENPQATAVITSVDPVALYSKLAPATMQAGWSCSVSGRIRFAETDFGHAFMAACSLQEGDYDWDRTALSDLLHSPLVGMGKERVWQWDRKIRGDRILRREEAIAQVMADKPPRMLSAFLQLAACAGGGSIEHGGLAGCAAGELAEQFEGRFRELLAAGMPQAYVREQQNAYYALCMIADAAAAFDIADIDTVARIAATASMPTSRVCAPQGIDIESPGCEPRIRIMDQRRAAQLPPRSVELLIVCDLTTQAYPLQESHTAANTLLMQLGAVEKDTVLDRARRNFRNLLGIASRRIVLERSLNDATADPLYPSAMLEEFMQAYAAVEVGEQTGKGRYGIPPALLSGLMECGEEDLRRDIAPALADEPLQPAGETAQPSELGEQAGRLAPHTAEQMHPELPRLSASQIENFLECPYKWFALNRLGANSFDEELGPREFGSFMHEIFQKFFVAFGQKVTLENLAQAEEIMFGSDGQSGVFADVLTAQYRYDEQGRKRLSRYVVIPGTTEEYEIDSIRTRVAQWLEFESKFLPQFTPVAFECRIPGAVYEGCEIKGIIDRIDIDEAGRAVIIDYKGALKSGHRPGDGKKFSEEAKVQALMYARILQEAGCITVFPDGMSCIGDACASADMLCSEASQPSLRMAADAQTVPGEQPSLRMPADAQTVPGEQPSLCMPADARIIPIKQVVGALYVSYNKGNTVAGAYDRCAIGSADIPTLWGKDNCSLPYGEGATWDDLLDFEAARVGRAVQRIVRGDIEPDPQSKFACTYCPVRTCTRRLS